MNWTTSRHAILNMSINIEPIIMYINHLESLSPNLQLDTKTTFLACIVIEIWDFETYGAIWVDAILDLSISN